MVQKVRWEFHEAAFSPMQVSIVLGLCGGVLVAVERLQRWLLRKATKRFLGSKSDPALAKAEPISDSGSASVIKYFRREKRNPAAEKWDVRETPIQTPRSVKKKWGRGALEHLQSAHTEPAGMPSSPWHDGRMFPHSTRRLMMEQMPT